MAENANGRGTSVLLNSLDALIEKYSLLKHPFYRTWTEGKLSRESLQLYAAQYYQHVRAFPDNLRRLAARTSGKLQELVNENLAEEVDPAAPHPLRCRAHLEGAVGRARCRLSGTLPGKELGHATKAVRPSSRAFFCANGPGISWGAVEPALPDARR